MELLVPTYVSKKKNWDSIGFFYQMVGAYLSPFPFPVSILFHQPIHLLYKTLLSLLSLIFSPLLRGEGEHFLPPFQVVVKCAVTIIRVRDRKWG